MNKIYYTWQQFDEDVKELVKSIKESKEEFDGIYGIPNGGTILSVVLSNHLNLKLIDKDKITNKTLVVDDISDTGKTLWNVIKDIASVCSVCCLFDTSWTEVKPRFCRRVKVNKEDWVIFPWEKEE